MRKLPLHKLTLMVFAATLSSGSIYAATDMNAAHTSSDQYWSTGAHPLSSDPTDEELNNLPTGELKNEDPEEQIENDPDLNALAESHEEETQYEPQEENIDNQGFSKDVLLFYRSLNPEARKKFRDMSREMKLRVFAAYKDPSMIVHEVYKWIYPSDRADQVVKPSHGQPMSLEMLDFFRTLSARAQREFRRLDPKIQKRIYETAHNPNMLVVLAYKYFKATR